MNRRREKKNGHKVAKSAARAREWTALKRLPIASAISAILAGAAAAPAYAADTEGATLEEVVVTAEKKTENLQDVPVSVEALGTEKLEQLHIENIDDYVEFLPGVTSVKGLGQGGNGISTTHVYMRGVVSGQDGNHSGPEPSVGTYFDEQPVTTIDGTIDMHVYDIERVEVLEGPQGTLYGASSEAGTIRIITNKPDPTQFSAGYDLQGNSVAHGGLGSVVEGFVNVPLTSIAAIRLVGWDEHDAGYISNVAGTNTSAGIVDGQRSFPTYTGATGDTLSNASTASNNYNTVESKGGRAALKVDIGDNWSVTPTFMAQNLTGNGFFGYDPAVGDLKIVHFGPETTQDDWQQMALTIEGKVSDFDIVYAGGYLNRNTHSIADYSDYSYFYDKYYGSGAFWNTQSGTPAEPQEFVITDGHYEKWSNELRVGTPQSLPVKATVGLFDQRQLHDIWEQYTIPGAGGNVYGGNPQGFASSLSIPGYPNTIWLSDLQRVDRDEAAFGQVTWDVDSHWSLTGGVRVFEAKNSEQGFYGYSSAYETLTGFYPGQNACGPAGGVGGEPNYEPFRGAPCTNLNQTVSETGHTQRVSVSYRFDPDRMVYATYSTGFRPGGINRVYDAAIKAIFPPYQADYLTNYELGWKTQWLNRSLRWNGAMFIEDWNNFQLAYLGPNSVTVVQNAASAQIKGIETNLEWAAGGGWIFSASGTYLDAKLTSNFCGTYVPGTTTPITNCPHQIDGGPNNQTDFPSGDGWTATGPLVPKGTRLPVVPDFKGNIVARYNFSVGDFKANVQGAYVYQTSSTALLLPIFQQALGNLPGYGVLDLSSGIERNRILFQLRVSNVLDTRGQITRFAECTPTTCTQPYIIPTQPRTVGIQIGQKF
jgi:iron complex outermembrane receptor protein